MRSSLKRAAALHADAPALSAVSHHPPISAYFYVSPANNLLIYGELKPKSKFLGNSAANYMGGENRAVLLDRLEDGEYAIGMPNM